MFYLQDPPAVWPCVSQCCRRNHDDNPGRCDDDRLYSVLTECQALYLVLYMLFSPI